MAQYDHGGGCPCGLYKHCRCQDDKTNNTEKLIEWQKKTYSPNNAYILTTFHTDHENQTLTISKDWLLKFKEIIIK